MLTSVLSTQHSALLAGRKVKSIGSGWSKSEADPFFIKLPEIFFLNNEIRPNPEKMRLNRKLGTQPQRRGDRQERHKGRGGGQTITIINQPHRELGISFRPFWAAKV